jgi:hypothetical protein
MANIKRIVAISYGIIAFHKHYFFHFHRKSHPYGLMQATEVLVHEIGRTCVTGILHLPKRWQEGRRTVICTLVENLCDIAKIFPRRKHAAAQQLFAATKPHFFRPVHPAAFAQAEKMPGIFVRRKPEVVQPK